MRDGVMSTGDRLTYMANQIARNFAVQGATAAALATSDHVATFWDPAMRHRILAGDGRALEPIAAEAMRLLREHGAPSPQNLATDFCWRPTGHGADAG